VSGEGVGGEVGLEEDEEGRRDGRGSDARKGNSGRGGF